MKKNKVSASEGSVAVRLDTPFKTAVKLSLGLFVAQLIVAAGLMVTLGGGAYIAYKSGALTTAVAAAVESVVAEPGQ